MQGDVIDETVEALKAFGATEEQIAAEKKNKKTFDCIVWEENKEVVAEWKSAQHNKARDIESAKVINEVEQSPEEALAS